MKAKMKRRGTCNVFDRENILSYVSDFFYSQSVIILRKVKGSPNYTYTLARILRQRLAVTTGRICKADLYKTSSTRNDGELRIFVAYDGRENMDISDFRLVVCILLTTLSITLTHTTQFGFPTLRTPKICNEDR